MVSRLVLASMVDWWLLLHLHSVGQAVYQHYSAVSLHQTPVQSMSLSLVYHPHQRFPSLAP